MLAALRRALQLGESSNAAQGTSSSSVIQGGRNQPQPAYTAARLRRLSERQRELERNGLEARCMPWLREGGVAARPVESLWVGGTGTMADEEK